MLASAPDLDDTSYWTPVEVLGIGGHAVVGLWVKKDSMGNIVDEVAIKEQSFRQDEKAEATDGENLILLERGIEEEAVFHVGLQQKSRHILASEPVQLPTWAVDKEDHIVHLRKYKYHELLDKSRMYIYYAPYGVFWRSQDLYKAFNQSLPEPFLWVLIHSLASAIRVMDGPLQEDAFLYKYRGVPHSPRPRNEQDYMLHCDIKPYNILLDYSPLEDHDLDRLYNHQETPEDLSLMYPRVLLSDFGHTKDMNPDHPKHIDADFGTREYQAPEQLNWGFQGDLPNELNSKLTTAHSVWALGKVLYDTTTGYPSEHLRERIMETVSASDYVENGQHYLPPEWEGAEDYSKPLRDLVRHCLHPSAALRPTPNQILESTTTALEYWSGKIAIADRAEKQRYRMYFRHSEKSDVPVGTKIRPDESLVERRMHFLATRYEDPEHPVRLPYGLWQDVYDSPNMALVDPFPRQMALNADGKLDYGDETMAGPYGVHLGVVEPQEKDVDDVDDDDDIVRYKFDDNGVLDGRDADQDRNEQRDRSEDNNDVPRRHRSSPPQPPEQHFQGPVKKEEVHAQDGEREDEYEDDHDVPQPHRSPSPEPPEDDPEDPDDEEETVETLSQLSIAEVRGRVRVLGLQGVRLSGKGVDKTRLAQALVNHRQGLGPPRVLLKVGAKKGKKRG